MLLQGTLSPHEASFVCTDTRSLRGGGLANIGPVTRESGTFEASLWGGLSVQPGCGGS